MSRKNKTLIAALGVLILLVGGYYGSTVWKKKKADTDSQPYTPPLKLGNLESSALATVETGGLILDKKGDAWVLRSINGEVPPPGIVLDQSVTSNMTYYMGSLYVDRVVEEEPEDLSIYGLSNPSARAYVSDTEGNKVEYILGDMTPSLTAYYVMEAGDPKVYSVSSYYADFIKLSLDKIRDKSLFPGFGFADIVSFSLLTPQTHLEVSLKPDGVKPYLATSFSTHLITSPFILPRGADGQKLNDLLAPLSALAIEDFIDDDPASLSSYGLDKPSTISLQTTDSSIDLRIGDRVDDKIYAKLADAPGVFTLKNLDIVLNAKPFDLMDKFALLVNIEMVDLLVISGGERTLRAEFQGKGDDAVYTLDGKKAEEKSFKTWYQAVIGLLVDAEYPSTAPKPAASGSGNIVIEYDLNTGGGERASITLIPFNRDFYALLQEGQVEFLISRSQVQNIYETAEKVVFEE